ncbi:MAG: GDP-4-dehydro-6-deoxy-D-mannose reductase [Candidatus Azotimanducaceae bacterium]
MGKDIVWVTGAGGFSGQHALSGIKRTTPDVTIVAIGRNLDGCEDADIALTLDVSDVKAIAAAAQKYVPRWVVHLAGRMPPNDADVLFEGNSLLTHQLLVGLHLAGVEDLRFLNVSSAGEYQPNQSGFFDETSAVGGASPYGLSKTSQTMLAQQLGRILGFDVVTARPFNLLGPGLSSNLVMGRVCNEIRSGVDELSLGRLDSIRDFLDIRDAVNAYWSLAQHGVSGECYNVCSGRETVIGDLVDLAIQLCGRPIHIAIREGFQKVGDADRACGVNTKLIAAVDWQPEISLAQSIGDMLEVQL